MGFSPEDAASTTTDQGRASTGWGSGRAGAEGKAAHFSNSAILTSPTLKERSTEDRRAAWRQDRKSLRTTANSHGSRAPTQTRRATEMQKRGFYLDKIMERNPDSPPALPRELGGMVVLTCGHPHHQRPHSSLTACTGTSGAASGSSEAQRERENKSNGLTLFYSANHQNEKYTQCP